MKTLLTLYTGDDWKKSQPSMKNGLDKAYAAWSTVAKKHKAQLLRASMSWFKNGYFTKYWQYDGASHRWEKVTKRIRPTAIQDKARTHDKKTGLQLAELQNIKREIAKGIPMVNSPQFSELVDNKLNQAVIFSSAMPRTRFLEPGHIINNPKGKLVVVKALGGSGGDQVKITQSKRIPIRYASVQQDFIDATKNGDLRDIRVCYIGDRPIYAYSRIAKPGNLYTNVHMGARMEFVTLKDIPRVLRVCDELMKPLRVFEHRIISFDFLVDAKKGHPFLVETNTMPGTNHFSEALLEKYFALVTRLMLDR